MRCRFIFAFTIVLLFFTLQVVSSADLEVKKFFDRKLVVMLEDISNIRDVDGYYGEKDSVFWSREVESFLYTMNVMRTLPFMPTHTVQYVPRYNCLAEKRFFYEDNNVIADTADLVFYTGHGANNYITTTSGGMSLANVPGLGDRDLEFLFLCSCSVIPAPIDVTDWASKWWEHDGKGIFQGLHAACGFRTTSWFGDCYTGQKLAIRLYFGVPVIDAWFLTNREVRQIRGAAEYPALSCVVFSPRSVTDTLYNYSEDPPRNEHWLSIAWEESI